MKHFNTSTCLLISLLFCLVLASCRDKTETAAEVEASVEAMEDIDFDDIEIIKSKSPLKRLAKAIVDGDAATVADFVQYPLKRPTPIPAIENKKEFIAYFPILFDKKFREKMRDGTFEDDWDEVGWRGVTYDNGDFWVNGTFLKGGHIYAVDYTSQAERKLQLKLMDEDKKTLHESLWDDDFTPVSSFETLDGKIAGRIDDIHGKEYRIALYEKPVHAGDKPKEVFYACRIYEGSGGNHYYLDSKWLHVVSINVVGPIDEPDLDIRSRDHWADKLGERRGASYKTWKEILNNEDLANKVRSVTHDFGEIQWEYDRQGNEIRKSYIDKTGKLFIDKEDGYAERRLEYDDQGHMTRLSYHDADGKLMINDKCSYAEERHEYDKQGHEIRETFHGVDGELTSGDEDEGFGFYAEIRWEYDKNGNAIKESYFGENGKPATDGEGHIEWRSTYDENGNRTSRIPVHGAKILGEEAYAEIRDENGPNGNQLREAYYDQDGQLVFCESGYAEIRWVYDNNGNKIAQIYFDIEGKVCDSLEGYAKVIWTYDQEGNPVSTYYFDKDGRRVKEK